MTEENMKMEILLWCEICLRGWGMEVFSYLNYVHSQQRLLNPHLKRTTPCQNSFVRNQFNNTGICITILNNQTELV